MRISSLISVPALNHRVEQSREGREAFFVQCYTTNTEMRSVHTSLNYIINSKSRGSSNATKTCVKLRGENLRHVRFVGRSEEGVSSREISVDTRNTSRTSFGEFHGYIIEIVDIAEVRLCPYHELILGDARSKFLFEKLV